MAPPPPVPSLARGGSLIAPALTLVNLVGYVLTVSASRALNQDAYGELNAYLGVLLVASVPGLALQAVVARSVATRPADEVGGARERALLVRAGALGLVVAGLTAAASPLLALFLHSSVAGPLWLAAQLAPFAVLSAAMGILQGAERFGALAAVIGIQAVGKAVGLLPLLLGGGPAAVLAALGAGTVLTMAAALVLVGGGVRATVAGLPGPAEALRAAAGLLTLLVLANLDVLLARNVLSGDESGRYSVGAVLAKAAFWLPQAVAVVVFPRLSHPEAGRLLLRKAVLVVAGLSGLELVGCLLLARPVLEITFGTAYGSLAPIAPLWVLQGGALSVVQLLVYRAIATHDVATSWVVGAVAVVEAVVVLVVRPSTPAPVIGVAAALAVALVTGLLLRSRQASPVPAQVSATG